MWPENSHRTFSATALLTKKAAGERLEASAERNRTQGDLPGFFRVRLVSVADHMSRNLYRVRLAIFAFLVFSQTSSVTTVRLQAASGAQQVTCLRMTRDRRLWLA